MPVDADPETLQVHGEQPVRDLREDPGAVAGFAVGRHRAAVGQVGGRLESQFEDRVAAPGGRGHEADPAAVVLKSWVIETGASDGRPSSFSGAVRGGPRRLLPPALRPDCLCKKPEGAIL